jgi:hypothetical protein
MNDETRRRMARVRPICNEDCTFICHVSSCFLIDSNGKNHQSLLDNVNNCTAAAAIAYSFIIKMKVRHRLALTSPHDAACYVTLPQEQDQEQQQGLHDADISSPLLHPSSCPMKPNLVLDLDENLARAEFGEEPAFPTRSIKVGI